VFTVRRDGRTLLRYEQAPGEPRRAHELPLEGAGTAHLTFAVEGPPAVAAFLTPTVGPPLFVRADGVTPQRRPDVVLFVMDTFRADNLAAYGGDPDVAPRLNAFAQGCARFVGARSPSTWTLPAHTSLFTATLPLQHGAIDPGRRLPSELPTLAEELAAQGYRTAAITDSAFVSRAFGLDEGFQWFEEYASDRDLRRTLRAASELLERDDGRPLFLFVQTYRSHTPYRTGPEEDRSRWQALVDEFFDVLEADPRGGAEALAGVMDRIEALYRDGARALDARVGDWLDRLEERRYFDRGYVFLTSDHGEAFLEHGSCMHGGKPYSELLRVPLLLRGPDVEPREVEYAVSLVDVPLTVADLVDFVPPGGWTGTSLLEVESERPVLAMTMEGATPWIAVVEGDRKVLAELDVEALELGECEHAFDLARDPNETRDLADGPARWPDELCRRVAPFVEALSEALAEQADVEMTDALRRQLAELGYAGE
jgi:arylsulfatase